MSDTPRTDARLGYGNEHHGANMLCRELERELNQAIKERDEWMLKAAKAIRQHDDALKDVESNKAGWDRASLVALRLERERNEARECLREAYTGAGSLVTPDKTLARWRKAAGLEPA